MLKFGGGPDPIWWTVGLRCFCRSLFVLLFFFQEKVIDVDAFYALRRRTAARGSS
jgi:hypothetical protein